MSATSMETSVGGTWKWLMWHRCRSSGQDFPTFSGLRGVAAYAAADPI